MAQRRQMEITIIPRKPLAPPPRAKALEQIASIALVVNLMSTPISKNWAVYWPIKDPLTEVRICRRSDCDKGDNEVMDGIRATNSGMNLLTHERNVNFGQTLVTRIAQDLSMTVKLR